MSVTISPAGAVLPHRPKVQSNLRRWVAPVLFSILLLSELGLSIWMMGAHLIPRSHDAFQFVVLNYYFLDGAATAGAIPTWMPYLTQGTVAAFNFSMECGLLQNVLLHVGGLLRACDLLNVIHIEMLIDSCVLLTGAWLLSRRLYRSPLTAFFVCVCVMGSALWISQAIWNFRAYYALPLVLYFGHRFFDTGRWRHLILAGNLLALQTLGNLPYLIPISSFICFAWFTLYILFLPNDVRREILTRIRWRWIVPAMLIVAASFAMAYAFLKIDATDLVSYEAGRNADNSVPYSTFVTYGHDINLLKWLDCVMGVGPMLDYTLYSGILWTAMVIGGAVMTRRRQAHILIVCILLLFFANGTPVTHLLYLSWPGMKFYRHIAYVSPIIRVLLCFVAGHGFETLLLEPVETPARRRRVMIVIVRVMLILSLLILALWLFDLSGDPSRLYRLIVGTVEAPIDSFNAMIMAGGRDAQRVQFTACIALLTAVFLIGLLLPGKGTRGVIAVLFVGLAATDAMMFRIYYIRMRSVSLNEQTIALMQPEPMPFRQRRIDRDRKAKDPRSIMLSKIDGMGHENYWTTDAFLFVDATSHIRRTSSWLRPLDELMKAFTEQPIDDGMPPLGYVQYGGLIFPLRNKAQAKVAGVLEDRVQFFSSSFGANSDAQAAVWLGDQAFAGDVPIFCAQPSAVFSASSPPILSLDQTAELGVNHRLDLKYEAEQFDANRLRLRVENNEGRAVWLMYCDTWHPDWKATVNGSAVPILRADLAYKAVAIPPGRDIVEFKFDPPGFVALQWLATVDSTMWLAIVGALIVSILCGDRPEIASQPAES